MVAAVRLAPPACPRQEPRRSSVLAAAAAGLAVAAGLVAEVDLVDTAGGLVVAAEGEELTHKPQT